MKTVALGGAGVPEGSVTVIITVVVLSVAGLSEEVEATDWNMVDWAGATLTTQWPSKLPVPPVPLWPPLEVLLFGVQA